MSFTEAVKTCLTKYVTFDGRARRSEYWYWALFAFLVSLAVGLLGYYTNLRFIPNAISLALMPASITAAVRRLHDIGKSGWFYCIGFIPIVGTIILIVWLARDSEQGNNQYGANPKESWEI